MLFFSLAIELLRMKFDLGSHSFSTIKLMAIKIVNKVFARYLNEKSYVPSNSVKFLKPLKLCMTQTNQI